MTDERPITVADIVPFLSPLGQEAVRAAVAEFKLALLQQQLQQAQGVPIPELPDGVTDDG